MPVADLEYTPPLFLKNAHLQTIYPTYFRRTGRAAFFRERIATPDSDFLDLDWRTSGNNRLAILSHGMEGCSESKYITGMVRALERAGWDCLAWNFRGCGGEFNRTLRFYHSGASDDLGTVTEYAVKKGGWNEIALIGFSMGGNITLKYLGEAADSLPPQLVRAVAFGVPCDLTSCVSALAERRNVVYMRRFLKLLRIKMADKAGRYSDKVSLRGYEKIRSFREFDEIYTAPIHGFSSASDYWTRCSSRQFIPAIRIPTLLINPLDDPFLGRECYPYEEARESEFVTLATPRRGGHIGFIEFPKDGLYWSERQALGFLS